MESNNLTRIGLALLAASISGMSFGCVAPSKLIQNTQTLNQRVRDSPIISGIEGLGGGYLVHNLTAELADKLGLAQIASSGNYASHLQYIEKCHENGKPIFLVGFSSGANEARLLAVACKKKNISVDCLFLLDPTYISRPLPGEIPKNVEEVVCFRSDTPGFIVGGSVNYSNLEDQSTKLENKRIGGSHLDLPKQPELHAAMSEKIQEKIGLASRGKSQAHGG